MKLAVYFPTWNAPWVSSANQMDLANLDSTYKGLTDVYLSFCKPDLQYRRGQKTFSGTGLEFSMEFSVVVEAIAMLRSRGVRVLIAIGGASYWGVEKNFNAQAIVDLVLDFGCDGVDFDYEVIGDGKGMTRAVGAFLNIGIVGGANLYISAAVWSTGAFTPDGSWRGMALDTIRTYGLSIDAINVMSYDAGPPSDYDPIEAIKAYRNEYGGDILMGFLVGNPGWGGYLLKESDIDRNAGYMRQTGKPGDGAFIWAHRNTGNPSTGTVMKKLNDILNSGIVNTPVIQQPVIQPSRNFLKLSNSKFMLDGQTFKPVGINTYWLGLTEGFTYPSKVQVEEMFIAVKRLGGNTIRAHTMGHSSGHPNSLWYNGTINAKAWDAIDYAYSMAKKYDIKIIAPLTDGYQWYNGNYGDFSKFRGLPKEAFWDNNQLRNDFKEYITNYLNHYNPYNKCAIKDDPCLGLIELGNELGNIRPGAGSLTIPTRGWLLDIGAHIKSVDVNHMVLCPTDESLGQSGEFENPYFDCFRGDFYWSDVNRIRRDSIKSQKIGKPYIVAEIGTNADEWFLDEFAFNVEGSLFWGIYPHENGINGGNKIYHNDGYTINYSKDNNLTLMKMARHFAKIKGVLPPKELYYGPEIEVAKPIEPKPNLGVINCPVCFTTFIQK